MKTPYVKPECDAVDIRSFSYVLMASNEGYPVDPFNPGFGTSSDDVLGLFDSFSTL